MRMVDLPVECLSMSECRSQSTPPGHARFAYLLACPPSCIFPSAFGQGDLCGVYQSGRLKQKI